MSDQLLSINEAAKTLNLGRATLLRYIKSAQLPAFRIGATYAINAADLPRIKEIYRENLTMRGTKAAQTRKTRGTSGRPSLEQRLITIEQTLAQVLAFLTTPGAGTVS